MKLMIEWLLSAYKKHYAKCLTLLYHGKSKIEIRCNTVLFLNEDNLHRL